MATLPISFLEPAVDLNAPILHSEVSLERILSPRAFEERIKSLILRVFQKVSTKEHNLKVVYQDFGKELFQICSQAAPFPKRKEKIEALAKREFEENKRVFSDGNETEATLQVIESTIEKILSEAFFLLENSPSTWEIRIRSIIQRAIDTPSVDCEALGKEIAKATSMEPQFDGRKLRISEIADVSISENQTNLNSDEHTSQVVKKVVEAAFRHIDQVASDQPPSDCCHRCIILPCDRCVIL